MKVPFNHNGVLEFHMTHRFIVGDKISGLIAGTLIAKVRVTNLKLEKVRQQGCPQGYSEKKIRAQFI